MIALIIVLIVIAAIALILIVLVQNSKGGGLSSGFSSSNAIMGVRKTTDFLEKATWGLAIFIMVMSIVCARLMPKDPNAGSATQIGAPSVPLDNTTAPDVSTSLPAPVNNGPAAPAQQPTTPPAK